MGSFVPAEKATVGYIDHLHTRIHANESVARMLSSFMLDLRQVGSITAKDGGCEMLEVVIKMSRA